MVNTDLSPVEHQQRPERSSSAAAASLALAGMSVSKHQLTPNRHLFSSRSAGVSPAKSSTLSSNLSIADLLLNAASSPAAGGGQSSSSRSIGSSLTSSDSPPDRSRKNQSQITPESIVNAATNSASVAGVTSMVNNPLLTSCDILTCGECQRQFRLADITNFIHHKVRSDLILANGMTSLPSFWHFECKFFLFSEAKSGLCLKLC